MNADRDPQLANPEWLTVRHDESANRLFQSAATAIRIGATRSD
jgi:hypothetical protein